MADTSGETPPSQIPTPNSSISSPNTNSNTNTNPTSTFVTSLPHFVTVKLTNENYQIWRAQMLPYLYGQQVFGFVDGTIPKPSILHPDGSVNQEYQKWFSTDQLILSIIVSSLFENIIAQVLKNKTSQTMWKALEELFSKQSQAKFVHLHTQLATLKKGSESITDYFKKGSLLADSLAAAGKPIGDIELVTYLMAGLGSEYDPIVASLTIRTDELIPETLLSHLLIFEARLSHNHAVSSSVPELSANLANKTVEKSSSSVSVPYFASRGGRASVFSSYRGRGRNIFRGGRSPRGGRSSYPAFSSNGRQMCQVCFKPDHTALMCFHRFNQAYQPSQRQSLSPNHQFPSQGLAANYSSIYSPQDPSVWYLDSGASNHLTSYLGNLNISSTPYHGLESIKIGDGTSLKKFHIGTGQISSPNGTFNLKNLLHNPSIAKNLIFKKVVFPLYAATCLPVSFYAIAQFPLYVDLLKAIVTEVPHSLHHGHL